MVNLVKRGVRSVIGKKKKFNYIFLCLLRLEEIKTALKKTPGVIKGEIKDCLDVEFEVRKCSKFFYDLFFFLKISLLLTPSKNSKPLGKQLTAL